MIDHGPGVALDPPSSAIACIQWILNPQPNLYLAFYNKPWILNNLKPVQILPL